MSIWSKPPVEDEAAVRFYEELRAHRLAFPRCEPCGRTFVPPRSRCSRCLSRDLVWIDAPTHGSLYAFTHQEIGLRFSKPDVLGIVELQLPDGPVRLLSRIEAELASLTIGMPVELGFVDVGEGLVLHQFRPIEVLP